MDGEIDPDEVERLLASDDPPRVVDIRDPAAFERGHIPGSENLPFPQIPDRAADLAGEDLVVTVCPHGQASVQAARLIGSAAGVDGRVESMRGGLAEWDGELAREAERASADEGPDAPF
ncbi:MAG: rhodanese-like domain-containing protein [Haloferacaceae archaeon]